MPTESTDPRSSAADPARIREIRDEWFAVGTDTRPADRATAENAISALYAQLGEPAPLVIWTESPLLAARTALTRRDGRPSLRPRLQETVTAVLSDPDQPSWATLVESTRGDEARVWASVWSQLSLSPEAALWSATRTSLGRSVEDAIGTTIAAAIAAPDVVADALWGQHEAGWIAFHDARRRLGVATFTEEADTLLDQWAALARSCGWWWPYQGCCVVSDRPEKVAMEPWPGQDAHRLHDAHGPALRFRDGWEIHAWHGTRVPRDFVEGEWSVADILAEPSVEIRQRAIERMGWDRFLTEAEFPEAAPVTHAPEDYGTLALYDVPEQLFGTPARMLSWTPAGSERDNDPAVFAMAVPTELTDPVEAFDWTWEHEGELPSFVIHLTTT